MNTLNRLAVLPIAVAFAACNTGDPMRDLHIAAAVDRNSVVASDSVRISVHVRNNSTRTVRAISPDSYGFCFHAFRVYKAGQEVAVPSGLCIATFTMVAPLPFDLTPGSSVTVVDYWKPGASTFDGAPLLPGRYRLVGIYHADERELVSGPVEVTLLP
jgi:hypothetical protein